MYFSRTIRFLVFLLQRMLWKSFLPVERGPPFGQCHPDSVAVINQFDERKILPNWAPASPNVMVSQLFVFFAHGLHFFLVQYCPHYLVIFRRSIGSSGYLLLKTKYLKFFFPALKSGGMPRNFQQRGKHKPGGDAEQIISQFSHFLFLGKNCAFFLTKCTL